VSIHALQRTIRTSYDTIAEEYATRIDGELAHKPFDCELLNAFAEQTKGQGVVADLGCGPGMVTQYLHDRGVSMLGLDLSPRMLAEAKRRHPALEFRAGDFTRLEVLDNQWAGIVALYALIHVPHDEIEGVLRDFFRVLQPGGWALLGFHVGTEIRHASDWWGLPVDLDFVFYEMSDMLSHVWGVGFDTELHVEREPYPEIELQTKRGYILAKKPNVTIVG
jgi:ubiquinone/menaquinone biosynthesis C-methylase UbiE